MNNVGCFRVLDGEIRVYLDFGIKSRLMEYLGILIWKYIYLR